MIRVWDGFLSGFAALVTGLVIGVPVWAAWRAVSAGIVALWIWAPMLALAFVGVIMVGSFLRKAGRGVHPLRDRRR